MRLSALRYTVTLLYVCTARHAVACRGIPIHAVDIVPRVCHAVAAFRTASLRQSRSGRHAVAATQWQPRSGTQAVAATQWQPRKTIFSHAVAVIQWWSRCGSHAVVATLWQPRSSSHAVVVRVWQPRGGSHAMETNLRSRIYLYMVRVKLLSAIQLCCPLPSISIFVQLCRANIILRGKPQPANTLPPF